MRIFAKGSNLFRTYYFRKRYITRSVKINSGKKFSDTEKVKDIQSFIGLAGYYRKFIEDFSRIAKTLTKLTKKSEKFLWNSEQQIAFDTLKEKLMTALVLKYPDFNEEF